MKKIIGVIIDSMDGEYQRRISENLIRNAINRQLELSFFVGSAMDEYSPDQYMNKTIFDLVNTRIIDGVIVVPSTMIHTLQEASIRGLFNAFSNVPVVSIGMKSEGAHSIVLDNTKATAELLDHMLQHVALEDLCYIAGPAGNWEARQRRDAWIERLEAKSLRESDLNTYEGSFHMDSGVAAVDHFIQHRGGIPRGIVAANDEMAIGAYERLSELGYHIPSDIVLAGFDNIQLTSDFFPPITTYDQRIDRLCYEALNAIEGLCNKTMAIGTKVVTGRLAIRESCGCLNLLENPYGKRAVTDHDRPSESASEALAAHLSADVHRTLTALLRQYIIPSEANRDRVIDYSRRLIGRLEEDLCGDGGQSDSFAVCLSSLVSYSIITEGRHTSFNRFMDRLDRLFTDMTHDPVLLSRIDNVLYGCSQVVAVGNRRQEAYFFDRFRQMYMTSRNVTSKLDGAISYEDIYHVLESYLPSYNISQCYVVMYRRPQEYDDIGSFIYPMMSELVFAFRDGGLMRPQSFVTHNMLPTEIMYSQEANNHLFMTLNTGNTYFGYIVFSTDAVDSTIYESLRSQVSEAMKRNQLNRKRLEAERALNNVLRELELSNELLRRQSVRDDLTDLYNRRGFYMEAQAYYREATEVKEPFYIIYGDIDGLKRINDTYGHDEGDYAIRSIGKTLDDCLGPDAIVARMSGDEFTALVKSTGDEAVIKASLKRIETMLAKINSSSGKAFDISISLGYAAYDYKKLKSMDDLLRQADSNLYRAKERHHMQDEMQVN